MATQRPQVPITPADQEADLMFKVQMKVAHWVYGYWKQGIAVICVILGVTFIVGQTSTCLRDRERAGSAALAEVVRGLPEPEPLSLYGLAPADDLSDQERVQQLTASAEALEAVANDNGGLASAEAWLRAADTWTRLEDAERAQAAFLKAYDADRGGIYTYAAGNRLAVLHREAGRDADARAIYRTLATSMKGFLAERALIDLMALERAAGDGPTLQRYAAEFRARFPDSPRMDEVVQLEVELSAQGT